MRFEVCALLAALFNVEEVNAVKNAYCIVDSFKDFDGIASTLGTTKF